MTLVSVADELRRREAQLSPRGRQTKAHLLAAARAAFEELGFIATRINDITERAGLGRGSFYSYWASKEEVFSDLILDLYSDLMDQARLQPEGDPVEVIRGSNRRYLSAYFANAPLLSSWEQACAVYPDFMALKSQLRERSVARVARFVSELQRAGLAHPHIDATCTAKALISMTNHSAYLGAALGQESQDSFTDLMRSIDDIWVKALGLTTGQPSDMTLPSLENHE